MLLLNFAHPLSPTHLTTLTNILHQPITEVLDIPVKLDTAQPFTQQVGGLIDQINLSPTEWQTVPLLINLPSLNYAAALLLAELHGRIGHWPAILRLRPVTGSTPPQFEVAEIINLQFIRDAARLER